MLGWQIAAAFAATLLVASGLLLLLRPRGRSGRVAVAAVRESGVVLGLFSAWQLAGTLAHHSTAGAVARGERILVIEKWLRIDDELSLNQWTFAHLRLSEAADTFYIYGHFNGLIVFLAWVFLAHRRHFASVRMSVILLTASCFVLHLVTVAPPRLLPHEGFIDVAARYGQSVYGPTTLEVADQLSAFPSVHVGWAALIGWWTWRLSPWRWGWVGVGHLVVTSLVVVVTGNHYWLDGIAAVGLLAVALLLQAAVPAALRAVRRPIEQPTAPAEEPALV